MKKRPDFVILIEKFETEEPLSNCGSLRRIESGPFSSLNFPNRFGFWTHFWEPLLVQLLGPTFGTHFWDPLWVWVWPMRNCFSYFSHRRCEWLLTNQKSDNIDLAESWVPSLEKIFLYYLINFYILYLWIILFYYLF